MQLLISTNRLRLGLMALVIGGALVFNGCASTRIKDDVDAALTEPEQPAEVAAEKENISVESINVVGDGDKVLITTTGVVRYTVFKLSDPSRLIVDLPDIDLSKLESRIDVDNYFLKEITVESYGGEENIGRIIIELKEGVDYDVKSGENSILVSLVEGYSFSPPPAAEEEEYFSNSSALLDADVIAEEIEAPVEELPGEEVAEALQVNEAQEAGADEVVVENGLAKSLLALELSEDAGATVINIVADGVIGNYTSFEVDDPSRVVVDLWGLTNASGWDRLNTGGSFIKAVRVGVHPDKTRLVFDSAGEGVPPYVVAKSGNAIKITFGVAPGAGEGAGLVEAAEADMPDTMDVEMVEAEEPFAPVVEALVVEEAVEEVVEEAVEELIRYLNEGVSFQIGLRRVLCFTELLTISGPRVEPQAELVKVFTLLFVGAHLITFLMHTV